MLAEEDRKKSRERDLHSVEELEALGWRVLTLWECEIKSIDLAALKRFLDEGND